MRTKLRRAGFEFRVTKQDAGAEARLSSRGLLVCALACLLLAAGCRTESGGGIFGVAEPRSLRDVPAARLAFRFEPDVAEEALPERLRRDDPEEPLAGVRTDFETRRTGEALLRTVTDPRGQRALALYGTGQTDTDFRIDLYSAEGQFIRNVLPTDLTGVFPAEVAWSPDGDRVAFVGVRTPSSQTGPTPAEAPADPAPPPAAGDPSVSVETPTPAASIPSVPVFPTEQIYVGDRDGYNLRPVTSRPGLIYFRLAWSPDGRTLAALACREDEWNARRDEGKLPAGRPRLLTPEGEERLLDDRLTDVAPVWSPDGSKVATAFEHELAVYDAAGSSPTAGGFPVSEPLRAASASYDARVFKKAEPEAKPAAADAPAEAGAGAAVLISFNPFVRLEWAAPETIYAQTAFVRSYRNEPTPTFKYQRWHVLHLSPQAALLTKESP